MQKDFDRVQQRRNRVEREGQESNYSYNPPSFQRNHFEGYNSNRPSNYFSPNSQDQYYQNLNYNQPNRLKESYFSGPAQFNNYYYSQPFQNSSYRSMKRDNNGNQWAENQSSSGHWKQPSIERPESQSISNISSDYGYSRADESQLSLQGLGEQNVGRYGKIEKPKKKKKKKDPKTPPPQPKTKAPSMVQQASEECYQQYGAEQQVEMDICPFNSSHIVPKGKLLTHIGRCQQTCDNARFYKVCRYNTCHWYRIDKIEAHEMVCSDRDKFKVNEEWEDPFSFPSKPKPSEKVESQFSEVPPAATKVSIRSVKSDPVKKAYEQRLIEDF